MKLYISSRTYFSKSKDSLSLCLHHAQPGSCQCFFGLKISTLVEDLAAACHVNCRHMGQPFTSVVSGWLPISLISNPHYSQSVCISCRHVKRTPRRSHSLKCLSHFCSTSTHLSRPAPCQGLISEDWRSLWVSDSVCHWITSRPFTWTTSKGGVIETWET